MAFRLSGSVRCAFTALVKFTPRYYLGLLSSFLFVALPVLSLIAVSRIWGPTL